MQRPHAGGRPRGGSGSRSRPADARAAARHAAGGGAVPNAARWRSGSSTSTVQHARRHQCLALPRHTAACVRPGARGGPAAARRRQRRARQRAQAAAAAVGLDRRRQRLQPCAGPGDQCRQGSSGASSAGAATNLQHAWRHQRVPLCSRWRCCSDGGGRGSGSGGRACRQQPAICIPKQPWWAAATRRPASAPASWWQRRRPEQ